VLKTNVYRKQHKAEVKKKCTFKIVPLKLEL